MKTLNQKIITICTAILVLCSVIAVAVGNDAGVGDGSYSETYEPDTDVMDNETYGEQTKEVTVAVNDPDRGSTVPLPGNYDYPAGSELTLTALSYDEWVFSRWDGDVPPECEYDEKITVVIDGDTFIQAIFVPLVIHELEINRDAGGTTNPSSALRWHHYEHGDEVTVEAEPRVGYMFIGWEGDVPEGKENDPSITLTMDEDKSIRAKFTPLVHQLDISTEPRFGGSTVPWSIRPNLYLDGEVINVEAIPYHGYEFDRWEGDVPPGHENEPIITINMDGDKELTAHFKRPEVFELQITRESDSMVSRGGLTIPRPTPFGSSHEYYVGTVLTVEAHPYPRFKFDRWEGDVPPGYENEPTITITMDEDKELVAHFLRDGINPELPGWSVHQLDIEVDGAGRTEPSHLRPNFYLDRGDGVEVTVEAIPYEYNVFSHWTGDHEGTDEIITIFMEDDMELTAHFEEVEVHELSISRTSGGTTDPSSTIGTHNYVHGEEVLVSAEPRRGYVFTGWSGQDVPPGQEDNPEITIIMDKNKEIMANFGRGIYQLNIDIVGRGRIAPFLCSSIPSFHYHGDIVTVEARSIQVISSFNKWLGDFPEGMENEPRIEIIMNKTKHLTAVFESPEPVADISNDRTVYTNEIITFVNNQQPGFFQYKWNFGDGTTVNLGLPMMTHYYTEPGDYTVELTVRNLGSTDTDSITITVVEGTGTNVLLLDWITDQSITITREIKNLMPDLPPPLDEMGIRPPPLLNDSIQREFWDHINSDEEFNIITRPPVYTEPRVNGNSYNITDYLEAFEPKMIIISDNILSAGGRWNLDKSERLALIDHLENGNALMVTGGSLSDLRLKTPQTRMDIGNWNHTNRLYLEEFSSLNDVLDNYRSSLTANIGLGLFPLYQEIREWVGQALEAMYENVQEPITKAALFAASSVVYSIPLLPSNVPFDPDFIAMERVQDITDGLEDDFELDLLNRYTKDWDAVGNISGDTALTSMGWQLQYPFVMARHIINQTDRDSFLLTDAVNSLVGNWSLGSQGMNQFLNFPGLQTRFEDMSLPGEMPLTADDLRNITENITASLLQLLENMYLARMDLPSQIEFDINFTIGNITVEREIVIPIPVALQRLFRPAEIAMMSGDGRAAVLKYEMTGQRYVFPSNISWDPPHFPEFEPIDTVPVSYRTTYFTFDPSLGCENSTTLVKNSLRWLNDVPEPESYELIGDMDIPSHLLDMLPEGVGDIIGNNSVLLRDNEPFTMDIDAVNRGKVRVFWYGADDVEMSMRHVEKNITVEPSIFGYEDYNVGIFDIDDRGEWILELEVLDSISLKTPFVVQVEEEDISTFDIELFASDDGWNFISFNLETEDEDLATILADIEGSYDRVICYDAYTDMWLSYVPGRPGHYNNLRTWDNTMGVWIRVLEDVTLTVFGSIPESTEITLCPGWNMVGLPSDSAGYHSLPEEVTRIGYFDATEEYNIAYTDDVAGFVFEPGKGYWIYNGATDPVTWIVEY